MMPDIHACPSTLRPGYSTYCPAACGLLFGRRTAVVSHVLPFSSPGADRAQMKLYNESRKRISISGYQEKYSLRLSKNQLLLADAGGTHILKPIPAERMNLVEDLPANEHLTMQIAAQVFGIDTAANGLIFFSDGRPAYITRRFDYKPDGTKYQLQDFATLSGLSAATDGNEYKIRGSYADMARIIDTYVPAAVIEKVRLYERIVFNYAYGNGDAHLKNFSLIESIDGDFVLSPAYDLVCSSLHISDADVALQGGLYDKDYEAEPFTTHGIYTGADFLIFANTIGIPASEAKRILLKYARPSKLVPDMIARSYLSDEGKRLYTTIYLDRAGRLAKQ